MRHLAENAPNAAYVAAARGADRRKTRAFQDAATLVRGNGPGGGNPFLRVHDADAGREPAVIVAMESRAVERGVVSRCVLDRKTEPEAWKRRRARATARRIAETGMNLRVRRAAALCGRSGALFGEVKPQGTTRECSECTADAPKDPGVRTHSCPECGFTADRDSNASVNVSGRLLRQFRDSPDPGGRIAAAQAAEAEATVKRRARTTSRARGGRARAGITKTGRSGSEAGTPVG